MDERVALVPVYRPEIEVLDPEPGPQFSGAGPQYSGAAQQFAAAIANMVAEKMGGQGAELSDAEKAYYWPIAFAKWLSSKPGKGQPRPLNTQQAYAAAWQDFQKFCRKPFWDVEPLDVADWVNDLRARPVAASVAKGLVKNGRRKAGQLGLSDASINQMVTAISAFYSFAARYQVRPAAGGRAVPLFGGLINPAKNPAVERPQSRPFGKSIYLSVEQLRALLQAIRTYGERNKAKSLRDYALFLCYVSTGARNSEVRMWKWGDLEHRGGVVYYHWANKGKEGRDEVPAEAWEAVKTYLVATGRLSSITQDQFIFTPLSDNVIRFRRMDPEAWDRNRALSSQEVNRCLRQYAKLAGLEPEKIHVHCLRHSAYMLYRESGLSLEERSRLLHHSSLQITSIYDHQVAGQRNIGWAKASTLLGL